MAVRTGAEVLVIGFLLETPPGGGRTRTRLHFVDCRPFGGRSRVAAVTAELAAFRRSARLTSVGRAAVRQLAAARRLRPPVRIPTAVPGVAPCVAGAEWQVS